MLRLHQILMAVCLLVISISCRPQILETLDLELPSKLVVGCNLMVESNSNLQPDSLYLQLSQSAPLFGSSPTDDTTIKGAMIHLFRNRTGQSPQVGDTLKNFNQTAVGSPIEGNHVYYAAPASISGQWFIQKGYDYHLTVQSNDGRSVNSSSSIPSSGISDTSIQILVTSPDEWSRNIQVKVRWRSVNQGPLTSTETPYFRINYRITGIFSNNNSWQNADLSGYPNQLVPSSSALNGVYEWQDRFDFYTLGDTTGFSNAKLEVAIQQINRPLFQYLQAIGQQGLNEGNPFGEPVVIPTNIQGGLGCLGTLVNYRMTRSIPW